MILKNVCRGHTLRITIEISMIVLLLVGGAGASQILYATGGGLSTVDPATGQSTYVGPGIVFYHGGGLAYDSDNGMLYATGYNIGSRSALFKINQTTGEGLQVGVDYQYTSIDFSQGGLAYDSLHNILYSTGFYAGNPIVQSMGLLIINPLDGNATPIGSFGKGIYLYGLGYDQFSDTLYANGYDLFADTPGSRLYTIDRTSGVATVIGRHGVMVARQLAYGGLAVDPATHDLLSTGSVTASESGLYRLNRITGAATLIGKFNSTSNPGSDGGLAFVFVQDTIDIIFPIVTNPNSSHEIPDDTDNEPFWGETAQLNITVTDDSGIASVTINLSEIGGRSEKDMINIAGNIYSTTTNASAGTPPGLYNLIVNATDTSGNSNTSVSIQLKIMKNGDCTGNGILNIGDALRLANNVSYSGNPAYALSSSYVCEVTGNGVINIGDALRLANNVSYSGNPLYILK